MNRSAALLCLKTFFSIFASLVSEHSANAEELGIGAAAGSTPGLSVHYSRNFKEGYHVVGFYDETSAAFSCDYQRHHIPTFGYLKESKLSFYAGLGLGGESKSETNEEVESYHLRIPTGVQWKQSEIRLQIFGEVAGRLGSLPKTNTSAEGLLGARAYF